MTYICCAFTPNVCKGTESAGRSGSTLYGSEASACNHCGLNCKHAAVQVRLLLLAALAQEHILYIGPPGTAKSELGRRLSRLCKGTFFERLLTRFSVPEVTVLCAIFSACVNVVVALGRCTLSVACCETQCQLVTLYFVGAYISTTPHNVTKELLFM